jgi:hypothetical protein
LCLSGVKKEWGETGWGETWWGEKGVG